MDWASRAVLAWRRSNTQDADFCVRALEEALARFGTPAIFNTDQGSQFTSTAFTSVLQRAGVRISMDGRGRWLDNVFIERLWRSLKYEEVYLKSYADGREARAGIAAWIVFYNGASQCTSRYAHEVNRVSWLGAGPAGALAPVRARIGRSRAARPLRSFRRKSHGPSLSGWIAAMSPRCAARRRVFAATPTMDAAFVRLSQGSMPSSAGRWTGMR